MGDVAEQRGENADGQHGAEPAAGRPDHEAQLEPVQPAAPESSARSSPAPEQQPDAEQWRQFQQFQQFQDFLRFQQAQQQQQQPGGEVVPHAPAGQPVQATYAQPPAIPPVGGPPALPPAPEQPKRRPRWLRLLASKYFRRLIYLLIVILAVYWGYQKMFGTGDEERPAAETGGGTYRTNEILSNQPYEAVRSVYHAIAGRPPTVPQGCGRFSEQAQQQFALNMGFADCPQAIVELGKRVAKSNDYAESIPSSPSQPIPGTTLRISSCDFQIKGGPPLGIFTVTKVEKEQWLITGHEPQPQPCPPPPTTPKPGPTTR